MIHLGVYSSPESKAEHARLLTGYAAATGPLFAAPLAGGAPVDVTVNEILLAFLQHVE